MLTPMDPTEPTKKVCDESTEPVEQETMARVPFVGRLHLYLPQFPKIFPNSSTHTATPGDLVPTPPMTPPASEPEKELLVETEEEELKMEEHTTEDEKKDELANEDVPFMETNSQEYLALVCSFLFLVIESLVRIITIALPTPVINFFYTRSRTLFNSFSAKRYTTVESSVSEKNIVARVRDADGFVDLCEIWNDGTFKIEEHVVQTGDGYLLGVHRIVKKTEDELKGIHTRVRTRGGEANSRGNGGKKVVYLHHGLLMNSEVWVCLLDKEQCLPFVLAEKGYDVWLGNNRGNKYSKKSIHHPSNSAKFWDFSIDDFAFHDIPDTINYILDTTNQPSLSYIGFSQGTAQAFATLSIHPKLNDKIDVFIALAPAMSPAGLSNTVVDALMKSSPNLMYLFFGRKSILSSTTFWQSVLYPPIFVRVIDMSMDFLFKWSGNNIPLPQKLAAYTHLYSFSSVKSQFLEFALFVLEINFYLLGVVHWFQIIRNKSFQMFDDDIQTGITASIANRSFYKVAKFPTRNITAPIALFWGGKDSLVDIEVMLKELPPHTVSTEISHFEHLDFLWGQDVNKLVFPHVLDTLQKYAFYDDEPREEPEEPETSDSQRDKIADSFTEEQSDEKDSENSTDYDESTTQSDSAPSEAVDNTEHTEAMEMKEAIEVIEELEEVEEIQVTEIIETTEVHEPIEGVLLPAEAAEAAEAAEPEDPITPAEPVTPITSIDPCLSLASISEVLSSANISETASEAASEATPSEPEQERSTTPLPSPPVVTSKDPSPVEAPFSPPKGPKAMLRAPFSPPTGPRASRNSSRSPPRGPRLGRSLIASPQNGRSTNSSRHSSPFVVPTGLAYSPPRGPAAQTGVALTYDGRQSRSRPSTADRPNTGSSDARPSSSNASSGNVRPATPPKDITRSTTPPFSPPTGPAADRAKEMNIAKEMGLKSPPPTGPRSMQNNNNRNNAMSPNRNGPMSPNRGMMSPPRGPMSPNRGMLSPTRNPLSPTQKRRRGTRGSGITRQQQNEGQQNGQQNSQQNSQQEGMSPQQQAQQAQHAQAQQAIHQAMQAAAVQAQAAAAQQQQQQQQAQYYQPQPSPPVTHQQHYQQAAQATHAHHQAQAAYQATHAHHAAAAANQPQHMRTGHQQLTPQQQQQMAQAQAMMGMPVMAHQGMVMSPGAFANRMHMEMPGMMHQGFVHQEGMQGSVW